MQQSTEVVGPVALGTFGVAGSFLTSHGTSWLAIVVAIIGAILAATELDPWRWRDAIGVAVFNCIIGIIGGAILAATLASAGWMTHPLGLAGASFAVAYVGHDAVQKIRPALVSVLVRVMTGGQK